MSQRMMSTSRAAELVAAARDADFRTVILAPRYGSRKYTRPKPTQQSSSSSDEADDLPLASTSTSSSAPHRPLPAGRRQLQTRVRRLQRAQTAAATSLRAHHNEVKMRSFHQATTASRERDGHDADGSSNEKTVPFTASAASAAATPPPAAASAAEQTPAGRRIHPQRFDSRDCGAAASSASAGRNTRQRRVEAELDGGSESSLSSPQASPPLLSPDSPSSPPATVFSASSDDESSASLSLPSPAVLSQVKSLLSAGRWRRRRQRRARERWQRGLESGLELLTERQERQAELAEMRRRSDEVQVSSRIQRLEERVLRGLQQLSRGQETLRREMLRSRAEHHKRLKSSRRDTAPTSGSAGSAPSSRALSAAAAAPPTPASPPVTIKPLQPPATDGVIHTEEQLLWTLTHFDAI